MLLHSIEINEQISAKKDEIYDFAFVELFTQSIKEELMVLSVFDLIQDEHEYCVSLQLQQYTDIEDKVNCVPWCVLNVGLIDHNSTYLYP